MRVLIQADDSLGVVAAVPCLLKFERTKLKLVFLRVVVDLNLRVEVNGCGLEEGEGGALLVAHFDLEG